MIRRHLHAVEAGADYQADIWLALADEYAGEEPRTVSHVLAATPEPGLSVPELMAATGQTEAEVTGLLRQLETAGLIVRTVGTNPQRFYFGTEAASDRL